MKKEADLEKMKLKDKTAIVTSASTVLT